MLKASAQLCRSVLFREGSLDPLRDAASSSIHVQYAACSVVKAFTANLHGIARVQQQQQQQAQSQRHVATAAAAGGQGLVIDETAVRRLKELQAESPAGKDVKLRVEVEGGGCSGFQYKFRLDDSAAAADDIVFERDGVQVVCDTVSMDFLKGAVVEFEDSLMRSAFQIASNPNSESTCGCGTSFVAKM